MIASHYQYLGENPDEIYEDLLTLMVSNQVPITADLIGLSEVFDEVLEESKYYIEKGLIEDEYGEYEYEDGQGC